MAENYKHLYHQMKKMVEQYQDVIVPGLREQLEKRVEVVRCRDCTHQEDCMKQIEIWTRDHVLEENRYIYKKLDFCSCGERRADGNDE